VASIDAQPVEHYGVVGRARRWLLSVKPEWVRGGQERDVCWREACRVISFHPVLMLRLSHTPNPIAMLDDGGFELLGPAVRSGCVG